MEYVRLDPTSDGVTLDDLATFLTLARSAGAAGDTYVQGEFRLILGRPVLTYLDIQITPASDSTEGPPPS